MNAHVSADVDVFHFLTLAVFTVIDNVEVFEVSTDVICEINAMGRVAACCSPVRWSDPAETSFAPNSGGKDSSCGRFHSPQRWS